MSSILILLVAGLALVASDRADVAAPSAAPCAGDCNGDGVVTATELLSGIGVALETAACPLSFPGPVTIDALVAAVNDAGGDCRATQPFPLGAYFWPNRAFGDSGSALRDLAGFGLNTVVAYYEYIKPDVSPFSGQPDCHGLVREAEMFAIDFFIGSPRGAQLRDMDNAALAARLGATVDCVGSSPRYRGWMFDEPELTGYDAALLARVIGILRGLDPHHRMWVNLNPYATDMQLRSFGAGADVLGFDVYPVPEGHYGLPNPGLSIVGELSERAQQAAPAGAEVWMIVQAFGYSDLDEGTQGRRPSPDELRFMAYDAVVHGARGVIFFGSHELRNTIPLDEAIWGIGVRRLAHELTSIGRLLIEGEPLSDLSVQPAEIAARGWQLGDSQLVIAANPSNAAAIVELCFNGGISDAYEMFDAYHPTREDACVRDALAPHGVHVYRVSR